MESQQNLSPEAMARIEELVRRHPSTMYSLRVDDSHIPYVEVPAPAIFDDEFVGVWREYNYSLFSLIRLSVRYQWSVLAWDKLLKEAEEDIRPTVTIDYLWPVMRSLVDIPTTFKDQLARGTVKLISLAEAGKTYDERTKYMPLLGSEDAQRRLKWHDELKKLAKGDPRAQEIYVFAREEFFECPDALHLRELHGRLMHDASSNVLEGNTRLKIDGNGALIEVIEPPMNIVEELEVIQRQRRAMAEVYRMFNGYAAQLYQETALN